MWHRIYFGFLDCFKPYTKLHVYLSLCLELSTAISFTPKQLMTFSTHLFVRHTIENRYHQLHTCIDALGFLRMNLQRVPNNFHGKINVSTNLCDFVERNQYFQHLYRPKRKYLRIERFLQNLRFTQRFYEMHQLKKWKFFNFLILKSKKSF